MLGHRDVANGQSENQGIQPTPQLPRAHHCLQHTAKKTVRTGHILGRWGVAIVGVRTLALCWLLPQVRII